MASLPLAIDVNTKQNAAIPPLHQCFHNCKEHPSKSKVDLGSAKMAELASTFQEVFNSYLHAHEPPPPPPTITSAIGWNMVCYALVHRYHTETMQDYIKNNIAQAGWLLCRILALWVRGHRSRGEDRDPVIWMYSI